LAQEKDMAPRFDTTNKRGLKASRKAKVKAKAAQNVGVSGGVECVEEKDSQGNPLKISATVYPAGLSLKAKVGKP